MLAAAAIAAAVIAELAFALEIAEIAIAIGLAFAELVDSAAIAQVLRQPVLKQLELLHCLHERRCSLDSLRLTMVSLAATVLKLKQFASIAAIAGFATQQQNSKQLQQQVSIAGIAVARADFAKLLKRMQVQLLGEQLEAKLERHSQSAAEPASNRLH